MPREQINFPRVDSKLILNRFGKEIENELDVDVPDSSETFGEPVLNVGWTPEALGGHVQLSVDVEVGQLKYLTERLPHEVVHSAIYTPSLSRHEINKLIRVLRLARDKAYGRDE